MAKRADEMSTRNLRDRRPLQTASKVLTSDLENLSNRVEHVKHWLEDAVNFHILLTKVRVQGFFVKLAFVVSLYIVIFTVSEPFLICIIRFRSFESQRETLLAVKVNVTLLTCG